MTSNIGDSDFIRFFFPYSQTAAFVPVVKARPQVEGESLNIHYGEVWKTIEGPDGYRFFFGPGSAEEIQLWCSRLSHRYFCTAAKLAGGKVWLLRTKIKTFTESG